mmetsp:Transcript_52107/g.169256  ORF Transcript_52107/g.169256 Transcript_52107/m.169256 type:complete len:309 (-) Transcript_52107:7-933(-)
MQGVGSKLGNFQPHHRTALHEQLQKPHTLPVLARDAELQRELEGLLVQRPPEGVAQASHMPLGQEGLRSRLQTQGSATHLLPASTSGDLHGALCQELPARALELESMPRLQIAADLFKRLLRSGHQRLPPVELRQRLGEAGPQAAEGRKQQRDVERLVRQFLPRVLQRAAQLRSGGGHQKPVDHCFERCKPQHHLVLQRHIRARRGGVGLQPISHSMALVHRPIRQHHGLFEWLQHDRALRADPAAVKRGEQAGPVDLPEAGEGGAELLRRKLRLEVPDCHPRASARCRARAHTVPWALGRWGGAPTS